MFPVSLTKKETVMSDNQKKITFEYIEKVASQMISQGIRPTVRGVIGVTGGKTETISGLLRDFFDKRDSEVSKMADELGSSAIAKLLAGEVQSVVDRKTADLNDIVFRQKEQITESIGLLEEKERDCNHRADMAEAKSSQAITEAREKINKANTKLEESEDARKAAVDNSKHHKAEAENAIQAAEQKIETLVVAAKSEADSLVKASNKQLEKMEAETTGLREQVKNLTVNEARREIEQEQFEATKTQLVKIQNQLAEQKTLVVQLQTENTGYKKDASRLEREVIEARETANKYANAQTQLIDCQKQITQLNSDLTVSNRERESLSRALSIKADNSNKK